MWVQQDGTAAAIADKLVARGVPKQDLVSSLPLAKTIN
ncbi:MAG: hypothetical protein EWV89_13635 [Microcystis wesenbergii Mw_QC_B_20070930_S4]|nr:MAG: hypothetical protein EWV89_13635 [Microcystis wesenbergii Mw_QC_B_20070930_S4]